MIFNYLKKAKQRNKDISFYINLHPNLRSSYRDLLILE